MSTDMGGGLRKASPEALALMMRNIKNNNKKPNVWVPSGVPTKKDNKANAKKIFFWWCDKYVCVSSHGKYRL